MPFGMLQATTIFYRILNYSLPQYYILYVKT